MDEDEPLQVQQETPLPSSSPIAISPSSRTHPTVHPVSDAPLCIQCQDLQLAFFDPQCQGCWSLVQDPQTTTGEVFAIIRQWVPQVQRSVWALSQEVRSQL